MRFELIAPGARKQTVQPLLAERSSTILEFTAHQKTKILRQTTGWTPAIAATGNAQGRESKARWNLRNSEHMYTKLRLKQHSTRTVVSAMTL
jgi:hypothetical protein